MFLWKTLKKSRSIIGFSTLFVVFFSALFVSPCFATKVDCTITGDGSTINYSLSSCDQSSLVSSSPIYVKYSVTYSSDPTRDVCGNNLSVSLYPGPANGGNLSLIYTYLGNGYSQPSSISGLAQSTLVRLGSPISTYDHVLVTCPSLFQSVSLSFSDDLSELVDLPAAPSGSLSITENGTYDVTSYATAVVDVSAEVIQGDYHDDLVSIKNAVVLCGAIVLVVYFFFGIYKLILGPLLGGKL